MYIACNYLWGEHMDSNWIGGANIVNCTVQYGKMYARYNLKKQKNDNLDKKSDESFWHRWENLTVKMEMGWTYCKKRRQ